MTASQRNNEGALRWPETYLLHGELRHTVPQI